MFQARRAAATPTFLGIILLSLVVALAQTPPPKPSTLPPAIYTAQPLHADDFSNRNLHNAKFDSTILFNVSFIRANLQGADFTNCKTFGARFADANVNGANFTDADLSNAHLAGIRNLGKATLSGTKFRQLIGVSLIGADLRTAQFTASNFYKADLSGKTDLRGVDLTQAQLVHANLREADLRGANLTQTNFRDADLFGANLEGATLLQTNFSGANLQNCKGITEDTLSETFVSATTKYPSVVQPPPVPPSHFQADTLRDEETLTSADLRNLILNNLDLHGMSLRNVGLPNAIKGTNFSDSDLSNAQAEGVNFQDSNLAGAKLIGAYLAAAGFTGAKNLSTTDFSGAYLDQARFDNVIAPGIHLSAAYLYTARFIGAQLAGADLSQTDLRNASLTNADLTGATLTGADLTGATLKGAKLAGVDLRQTFGLTRAQLTDAATYDPGKIPARLITRAARAKPPTPSSPLAAAPPPSSISPKQNPPTIKSLATALHLGPRLKMVIYLLLPSLIGFTVILILFRIATRGSTPPGLQMPRFPQNPP